MTDHTLAVAHSHVNATHQTGASARKPHVRIVSSGGKRRDDSLNPIVERVRRQLIELVTVHSNRNKRDVSDEARDDHGQWTSGGDWASSAIQADGSVDLKAAMAGYSTAHYGTDVRGMAGCKPDEALSALQKLGTLQDKFPGIKIASLGMTDGQWGQGRIAQTRGGGARASEIQLSPEYWTNSAMDLRSLYGPDNGFHPTGTNNPSGYITHEFGHAVSDALFRITSSYEAKDDAAHVAIKDWIHDQFDQSDPVSGYARTSVDEKFAELFSGAMTKGSDVYDTPTALSMRDMLRETGVWKGPTK
jgi:hypothetical protein